MAPCEQPTASSSSASTSADHAHEAAGDAAGGSTSGAAKGAPAGRARFSVVPADKCIVRIEPEVQLRPFSLGLPDGADAEGVTSRSNPFSPRMG